MDAVIDTGLSLSFRDTVLRFLYPLFPAPSVKSDSQHLHALTRLLVTLSDPSLTVPLLVSLVPREKLLAYQLAFDLSEGGARDYLESIRTALPDGDNVSSILTSRRI
jgi:26S proteasome regulatory subunit N2